jgi:uncharacterized protein YfbU (UPF0304 family)
MWVCLFEREKLVKREASPLFGEGAREEVWGGCGGVYLSAKNLCKRKRPDLPPESFVLRIDIRYCILYSIFVLFSEGIVNMKVITLRVTDEFRSLLDRLCTESGLNISDLVRKSVGQYAHEEVSFRGVKKPELSEFERLQLYHLLKIRRAVEKDSTQLDDDIKIIESGWRGEFPSLFLSTEFVTEEVTQEVRDILKMYVDLKRGYNESKEKRGLTPADVEFRGFDHELEEGPHQDFAHYLLIDRGRYSQLKDEDGNVTVKSDGVISPLSAYRAMLPIWRKHKKHSGYFNDYQLSIDQVHEICLAPTWKRSVN